METKVLAIGFAERMPESGGLESGVVLVQSDQQVEVVQRGVIESDQIDFTDTKVGIGSRCLSDQQFVVGIIARRVDRESAFLIRGPVGLMVA